MEKKGVFSTKIVVALGLLMIFLTMVAFILGKPPYRDKRIYQIVRSFEPYVIEKSLGGLKILSKTAPKFKEEPSAVDFYKRLEELDRQWAAKHLRLQGDRLEILDDRGKVLKTLTLQNEKERRFVQEYYGVKAQ